MSATSLAHILVATARNEGARKLFDFWITSKMFNLCLIAAVVEPYVLALWNAIDLSIVNLWIVAWVYGDRSSASFFVSPTTRSGWSWNIANSVDIRTNTCWDVTDVVTMCWLSVTSFSVITLSEVILCDACFSKLYCLNGALRTLAGNVEPDGFIRLKSYSNIPLVALPKEKCQQCQVFCEA